MGLIVFGSVLSSLNEVGKWKTTPAPDLSSSLAVGQCFTDTSAIKVDFHPVDCSDPNAVFELASRGSACPDGKSGEDSQYSSITTNDTTYCFVLNFQQGRCYAVDDVQKTVKLDDCAAHRSAQVTKRVDGSTDVSVCDGAAKSVTYPEPARVYCLGRS